MFTNDFAKYITALTDVLEMAVEGGDAVDSTARASLTHLEDDVIPNLATKAEVISGAGGGIPEAMADQRYAPIALTGTVSSLSTAVSGKADASHTHTGVYQPVGDYVVTADIAGKANTTDVATALSGKADTATTYTKTQVDTALSGKQPTGTYLVVADITGKADTTTVNTALALKSDTTHNHDATYAALGHTHTGLPTAILTTITGTETDTQVNSALLTKNTYFLKSNVSTSGTVNSNSLVYSTARANALFAPLSGSLNYAPITGSTTYATQAAVAAKADQATTYTKTEVDTALSGVSGAGLTQGAADLLYAGISHNHTGVYQPVGSYLVAADIAGKANTTDVTTALAGKSDTNHIHADMVTFDTMGAAIGEKVSLSALAGEVRAIGDPVYQPIGTYLVAADITGKANTTDVDTALGLKANQATTYTKTEVDTALTNKAPATGSTVYQAKANMLVTGAETTYPSKAYADTLYAPIGGGSNPTTFMRLREPDATSFSPTMAVNAGGIASLHWGVVSNTTPLTPFWCPANANGPFTSEGTFRTDVFSAFQNRTANTYRITMSWELGMLHKLNTTGTTSGFDPPNATVSWMAVHRGVPFDGSIYALLYYGFWAPDARVSGTTTAGNGTSYPYPIEAHGFVETSGTGALRPTHKANVTLLLGPNDMFQFRYWTLLNASVTSSYVFETSSARWSRGLPGNMNVLTLTCVQV